jgi:hypothetical protein
MKRLLLGTVFATPLAADAAPGPPVVVLATALTAAPNSLSSGNAGPLNRQVFELTGFDAADPRSAVLCIYPKLVYRCRSEREPVERGARQRVVVTIPDLDLGKRVIVRFTNSYGARDYPLELANASHVVHEIEALPLQNGGQHSTGNDGTLGPNTRMTSERATTMPAMVSSTLGAPAACDQIRAEWVGASATDPLFTSQFGAMSGSVVLTRPVQPGSPLRPDNLPEWTLSYPLSANRVQFIAHYEVIYRVGTCADRVVSPD